MREQSKEEHTKPNVNITDNRMYVNGRFVMKFYPEENLPFIDSKKAAYRRKSYEAKKQWRNQSP